MELSQVLKLNALSKWSPNGELLACVDENTVKLLPIGDPATGQVFAVSGTIEKFSWAPNSKCFCCLVAGAVHIFSLADPTSIYKIEDPQLPLVAAEWTPDSSQIVTATDCGIRLSFWRVSEETQHLEVPALTCRRPKYPLSAGHAFSPTGKFWAVCTRVDCVDSVEVFCCPAPSEASWTVFKSFQVKTADLQDLLWTPDETSIVVWDSPVHGSRIFLYHISGKLLHQIERPCDEHLSIRHVELHAASRLLAVGFCDGTIRLFSTVHWREELFSPLLHKRKILMTKELLVLKEELRDSGEITEQEKLTSKDGASTSSFSLKTSPRVASTPRQQPSAISADADRLTVLNCVSTALAGGSGSSDNESSSSAGEGDTSAEEKQMRSPALGQMKLHKTAKAAATKTLVGQNGSDTDEEEEEKKKRTKKKGKCKRYFLLPTKKTDASFSTSSPTSFAAASRPASGKKAEKLQMYFPVEKESAFSPEGILLMRISPCGTFLASTNAEQPTVVFVWNLTSGKLQGVSVHRNPVKQVRWNPHPAAFSRAACLAICTGDPRIFMWTVPWQSVVELPRIDRIRCRDLQWSSQGEALLLHGKGKGILLYPSFLYAPPSSSA